MASPVGGLFVFAPPSGFSAVTLSLNNGSTISPAPVSGNFNIEVFTAAGVATVPGLDSGFQAGVIDPNGAFAGTGFLTGTTLTLGTGNYAVTDSVVSGVGQTADTIILGSGNQTVIGAPATRCKAGRGRRYSMP